MGVKTCFKCGQSMPLDCFYTHKGMKDGLLGKCKDCTKSDVMARRRAKLDKVRAYDRMRAKRPHAVASRADVVRRWAVTFPERRGAQVKANNAVRSGSMRRPSACQSCGEVGKRLEKHHDDYSKPLDVKWLCKPCHYVADRDRRRSEGAA